MRSAQRDLRLLAGFVSFSTGMSQPTVVDAAVPSSTAMPLGVTINVTDPLTSPVVCFTGPASPIQFIEYLCAVPVNGSAKWSGNAVIGGIPIPALITDPENTSDSFYRVCRYTPSALGTTTSNAEHPASYLDVTDALTNQNFLVIRAGDGTTAFTCPGDDPGRPGNSNTFSYQPAP